MYGNAALSAVSRRRCVPILSLFLSVSLSLFSLSFSLSPYLCFCVCDVLLVALGPAPGAAAASSAASAGLRGHGAAAALYGTAPSPSSSSAASSYPYGTDLLSSTYLSRYGISSTGSAASSSGLGSLGTRGVGAYREGSAYVSDVGNYGDADAAALDLSVRNPLGANHCFLNVCIDALRHLQSARCVFEPAASGRPFAFLLA